MEYISICWLGIMSFEDIRTRQVSLWILVAGGIVLCARPIERVLAGGGNLTDLLYSVIPGVIFLLLALATEKIGAADGIAICFLGLFAGRENILTVLCVSLLLMSACSVVLLVTKKVNRHTKLPFFPFLCLGFAAFVLRGWMVA